ncbi:MAG: hypothetical protein ABSD73_04230 [Candidatus Bathyarchaeia archaeon]|jgi:hypothetical protein
MDKAFLQRLDKSESSRIEELTAKSKEKETNAIAFLKSEIVRRTLQQGPQNFLSGFDENVLPNLVPFSDRTFVEICPTCKCVQSPLLLVPYLERDLVVPILDSDYIDYAPAFVETILRYPSISACEFYGIRQVALQNKSSTISSSEVNSVRKGCLSSSEKSDFCKAATINAVIDDFVPYYNSDLPFLLELLETIQRRNRERFKQLYELSYLVSGFRCSQAFSFVPQVELKSMEALTHIPEQYRGMEFSSTDVRNVIMDGLKISYNPSIPLETYLDIVTEHRSRVQSLVRELMGNLTKTNSLSELQIELEKINAEVRGLQKSNKAKVLDFVTNFAVQNKGSIIAGLITAASIGLMGFGLVGCGAGVLSSLGAKAVSKKASISIPAEGKILAHRVTTYFGPSYEKLLAATLSTDLQAVQIWRLQKTLSKKPS